MVARALHKLTVADVKAARTPGKTYVDGGGLRLTVRANGHRTWELRYMRNRREREMSLGDAQYITLAEARKKADEARSKLAHGIDPLDQRQEARAASKPADLTTFQKVAEEYITLHGPAWKSAVHREQWISTLKAYAYPKMGDEPIATVSKQHILKALEPIWTRIPETASRVRGRIEIILAYATAKDLREGPNPAAWQGNLQFVLPSPRKLRPVVHHAALDWHEAPAFMATLRRRDGIGARALEFAILTAVRTTELRGATWNEIDLERAIWVIPAERMKAAKPHRVPLSDAALALLRQAREFSDGSGLVFPGQSRGVPLSIMTLTAVLRRMGRPELTAHGFRSTFRDWAAEATNHENHVAEAALAHTISDKVEAAYRRGELLAKRALLMSDWADYLAGAHSVRSAA